MLYPALKFFHRQLWRRLPHGARRSVLLRAAAWQAPRSSPDARGTMPVVVTGMLRQASGLGEAARACHDTLKAAGLPVYGVDLTRRFVQDADFPNFTFADGGGLRGEGTVLLHVSGPLVPLAMAGLGR